MKTKTLLEVQLGEAKATLSGNKASVAKLRDLVKQERASGKVAKVAERKARKEASAKRKVEAVAKVKARIAKAQAKLEALQAHARAPKQVRKANRKAGKVKTLVENGVAVSA